MIYKLHERVDALKLNLKGQVVLTEAATGPYAVTPILAALAGAKVFAYCKSTRYGSVEQAFSKTRRIYEDLDGEPLDITFIDSVTPDIIAQADVITNSGHLRPLNEKMLRYAKNSLVIPLMYEAWEWRDADMDIDYIRQRGFKVGATNERHPEVDVFNFLGDMAVKLILDAGLCLYKCRFILVCNNDFGFHIAKVLSKICDGLAVIDRNENKHKYDLDRIDWIGNFPEISIPASYRKAEGILFTAYPFNDPWIGGPESLISLKNLMTQVDHPFILRYSGDINTKAFDESGVRYFPRQVSSGHMGVLPSSIGYNPIIRLQAGGLKAAEAMISGKHHFKNVPITSLL